MSYILFLLGSFHPSRCAWLRDLVFGLGQEGRRKAPEAQR